MDRFLTTYQVANALAVHPATVRKMCLNHEGTFAIKVGAVWRIRPDAFDALTDGQNFGALNQV